VWARRLSPLFLLGCAYFSWKQLAGFNYSIALLVLLNPLTYVHEGLRTAFLGGSEFLPLYFCMPAVIIFCAVLILLLARAVKHRLDPV
jgi:ABC-type polysaccharide/polyol phosphate export permease